MKLSSQKCNTIKTVVISIMSACSIYALLYYTYKFYIGETLSNNMFNIWVLFGFITIIALILGVVNSIKLNKMSTTISQIANLIEDCHYSEMAELRNAMECILDLDCEMRDKNDDTK